MSKASHQSDSQYIHGTSAEEQARLSLLNDLLNQACLKEMNMNEEERILDIGSGLGQFTRLMAKTPKNTPYVLGIERNERQIQQARDFAQQSREQELVVFRQGDATGLPLESDEWESFDLVHARFVLEHVKRPIEVVQQMVAACKPGGRLILADDDHDIFRLYPECPGFNELWQAYIRSYDRLFTVSNPGAEDDMAAVLNPESLVIHKGYIEPNLENAEALVGYQFERLGYFCFDGKRNDGGEMIFNKTVGLRDSWAKQENK